MAYQPKSKRKFLATSLSAAVVASAVAPTAGFAASAFPDVGEGSFYYEYVTALSEAGIIDGRPDGTFDLGGHVNRAEAAKMISGIIGLDTENAASANFADVKDGVWYTNYINALHAEGLIDGVSATEFAPNDKLTRAQFAKLVVDAYGLDIDSSANVPFNDLKDGAWYVDYVKTLYSNGLIDGTTATTFSPDSAVKRADFAKLLTEVDWAVGDTLDKPVVNGVEEVTAINNTTVEVNFEDSLTVEDVDSLNFAIDGLDVKNAAIKQTDSKTVVLTTSVQEGGKEYTLTINGVKSGSFEGVSAVTPEDISILTNSVQGVVGQEVTVQAQVDVEDGQSAAGIPVTFNIDSFNDTSVGDFNKDQVVEVYTNEDGVAEYSYTQYAGGEDRVVAYATGDTSVRATNGLVYWGVEERLTIEEVTEGNSLANGQKKVYKVKGLTADGDPLARNVNIAFEENVNVSPEDAVDSVVVTDSSAHGDDYPYEYTTGGVNWVEIGLDENGEATFTLEGTDASVTPIVFIDNLDQDTDEDEVEPWGAGDNKLGTTELQAKAPTVSFELTHTFGISVESIGDKNAAAINNDGFGEGGRDYKAVVTDEDGNVVPEGTPVDVLVESGNGDVYFTTGDEPGDLVNGGEEIFHLEADENGEISFTLTGEQDAYATPTVFLDKENSEDGLDDDDLQEEGEIVYFTDAVVEDATLTVVDEEGDEVSSVKEIDKASFEYQSVDQNGKPYFDENYEATFEVEAGVRDVVVTYVQNGVTKTEDIKRGTTESVTADANAEGLAVIEVEANGPSDVDVNVSASQNSLPNLSASVEFTAYDGIPSSLDSAEVTAVNKEDNELNLVGAKTEIDYTNATFYDHSGEELSVEEFESLINAGDTVDFVKGEDGKHTFTIVDDRSVIEIPESVGTLISQAESDAGFDFTVDLGQNTLVGDEVEYLLDGNLESEMVLDNNDVQADQVTFTVAGSDLTGTEHELKVVVRDDAGNVKSTDTVTLTTDFVAPKVTGVASTGADNFTVTFNEEVTIGGVTETSFAFTDTSSDGTEVFTAVDKAGNEVEFTATYAGSTWTVAPTPAGV